MEFILNEYSLNGQYSSMEEFVGELGNVVGCINIIRKNPVNNIIGGHPWSYWRWTPA